MKRPTEQATLLGVRCMGVVAAMGIGAGLVFSGHATVAEAGNYVNGAVVYMSAVAGAKRKAPKSKQ
ncbi:hypothetical protein ACEZDB_18360 [Streptacidiphilus sp. N1-3]|uniref:Uncharacterized protein n=1 Tax=Streptacidiphilus alkalitolerans TaxID=3342712 RepID=A0ABV6X448_9ACTN